MLAIVAAVIGSLELALTLWVSKDKRKYIDQLADLKRRYYDEENKPVVPPPGNPNAALRSDAVLDVLRNELCILYASISADIGKPLT